MPLPTQSITSDLRKLASGSVIAFTGTAFGNGLTYLFGLSMGRLLGPDAVGYYFVALMIMQICASLSRVGLSDGILRYIPVYLGENNLAEAKGTLVISVVVATILSMLLAGVLVIFAAPLSELLFDKLQFTPYIRWIAATLPAFTLLIVLSNSAQAMCRMDLVVLCRDIVQPLTMLIVGLTLFYFLENQTSFLQGYFASMLIAVVASTYVLIRAWPNHDHEMAVNWEHWKTLFAFSLPLAAGDVVHYLFRWSDVILLTFLTSSMEVGIYNAALRTTLLLNILAMSVSAIYGPIIADHYHQQRHDRIQILLSTIIRWSLILASPIIVAMALAATNILHLWGQEFVQGVPALCILAISQLAVIASTPLGLTLLMSGHQYVELGNIVFILALNTIISVSFIPSYGIIGVAGAMCISQGILLILRTIEVRRILSFNLGVSIYLKTICLLVPAIGLGVVCRWFFISTWPLVPTANLAAIFIVSFVVIASYGILVCRFGLQKEDLNVWTDTFSSKYQNDPMKH